MCKQECSLCHPSQEHISWETGYVGSELIDVASQEPSPAQADAPASGELVDDDILGHSEEAPRSTAGQDVTPEGETGAGGTE